MGHYPAPHLHLAAFVCALMLGAYALLPAERTQALTGGPDAVTIEDGYILTADMAPPPPPAFTLLGEPAYVQPGDSMARIFRRHGLAEAELRNALFTLRDPGFLNDLQPNDFLTLELTAAGELATLTYRKQERPLTILRIVRTPDGFFKASWHAVPTVAHRDFAEGRITAENDSLWKAAKAAGLSDPLIMAFTGIFQWDISFALDMRLGDRFSILYERTYALGEQLGAARIVGARFHNSRRNHEAVFYKDPVAGAGYYTRDGYPVQKAFLRDPVNHMFVSSRFNPDRFHPIHKRRMPHRGVDYAALKGTPVRASGRGVIVTQEFNRFSGNFVVLQHGEQYTTKYLHLSGFAKGQELGQEVQQGQVIGYVGATGLATAAHLHYEFLVNGVHHNPQTYPLPSFLPIAPGQPMDSFLAEVRPALLRLETDAAATQLAAGRLPPPAAVGE